MRLLGKVSPTTLILTDLKVGKVYIPHISYVVAAGSITDFRIWDIDGVNTGTIADKVTNGGFAADSDWTKGTGWTITGGVAVHTPHGGVADTLSQDCTEVANDLYKLAYTLTISASSVTPSCGGATLTTRSTGGTYTEYFLASGAGNLTFTPTANSLNCTIDNVSLKKLGVSGDAIYEHEVPSASPDTESSFPHMLECVNGCLATLAGAGTLAYVYME